MGWGWWLGPGSGIRSGIVMSSAWHSLLLVDVVLQVFRTSPYLPGVVARGGSLIFCFSFFLCLLFFLLVNRIPTGRGVVCWQQKKTRRGGSKLNSPFWTGRSTSHDTPASPRNLTVQEFASPTTTHHHDLTVIPGLIPQVERMGMPTAPLQLAIFPSPGATPSTFRTRLGSRVENAVRCGGWINLSDLVLFSPQRGVHELEN